MKPKKFDPETGDEIVEEEAELEDGEEKSWAGFVIRPEIFPKSVILFDTANDADLLKRIKDSVPEAFAAGTHYTEADMKRRIAAYRKANNSAVAEPPLRRFFEEQKIDIHSESDCTRAQSEQVVKSLKIYIERFEKPFNYMTFDEVSEKEHVDKMKVVNEKRQMENRQELDREEMVEREVRRQKEAYTKKRLDQIKDYERDILDQKSQPIRQYLMDNLVPILTEGLLEVCKRTPEDPVDYLAEYLFRRSLDVPYPDPTSY